MQLQLRRSKSFFRSGFTLIEMLVVITIIGLIVAYAATKIFEKGDEAKSRLAKVQIAEIGGQLDLMKLDVGRYPTTSEGLKALLQNPGGMNNWTGPYVKKEEQIKDPWSRDFVYTSPGQRGAYDLVSLGADGKEGGDGPNRDVSN